jgi:hypothetical protein
MKNHIKLKKKIVKPDTYHHSIIDHIGYHEFYILPCNNIPVEEKITIVIAN